MVRHPYLFVFQLACVVALLLIHRTGRAREWAESTFRVWVTALGERERQDGSWEGIDLLSLAPGRSERLQLTLRPERPVRAVVEAVLPGGVRRLFPVSAESPILVMGRAYAIPGPIQFWEVAGRMRLRIALTPVAAGDPSAVPEPAVFTGQVNHVSYRLSDGAPFATSEAGWQLDAGKPQVIELEVGR